MFIEILWKKNPKFVEDEIKRIFCVNEENDEMFNFTGVIEEGRLHFVHHARSITGIDVGDFDIKTNWSDKNFTRSAISKEWRKVMKKVFGDKYVYHFIAYRNKQLDEYVAKFNQETADITDEMGYGSDKGQTK